MKRLLTFFFTLAVTAGLVQAQIARVSTNLADYACLGTLNAAVEYQPVAHWSFETGARYNNWNFGKEGNHFQDRRRTFYAGARFWPSDTCKGWWGAARMQAEEYNRGGLFGKPQTEEGNAFGISTGLGWSHPLPYGLRMDAGLFFWGGSTRFCSYAAPRCGRCLVEKGRKGFIRYDCAVIALTYDINWRKRSDQH